MKITVQDANILIDLECAGVLGLWFELGIETHTTELIRLEISKEHHREIHQNIHTGRIRVHAVDMVRMQACHVLARKTGKISFRDASCYYLATDLDAVLITGDKALRALAEDRCVEVHGTIWIFDRLVEAALLEPWDAADKLEHLQSLDRYLPKEDCLKRIKKWRAMAKNR